MLEMHFCDHIFVSYFGTSFLLWITWKRYWHNGIWPTFYPTLFGSFLVQQYIFRPHLSGLQGAFLKKYIAIPQRFFYRCSQLEQPYPTSSLKYKYTVFVSCMLFGLLCEREKQENNPEKKKYHKRGEPYNSQVLQPPPNTSKQIHRQRACAPLVRSLREEKNRMLSARRVFFFVGGGGSYCSCLEGKLFGSCSCCLVAFSSKQHCLVVFLHFGERSLFSFFFWYLIVFWTLVPCLLVTWRLASQLVG